MDFFVFRLPKGMIDLSNMNITIKTGLYKYSMKVLRKKLHLLKTINHKIPSALILMIMRN